MNSETLFGLFRIAGQAFPVGFDPRTWMVEASIDPNDLQSINLAQEHPAKLESASGGAVEGFARHVDSDPSDRFQLRLKSITEGENE